MTKYYLMNGPNAKPEMMSEIKPKLLMITADVADFVWRHLARPIVITSIIRAKGAVPGESGIHALGRGIDISVNDIPDNIQRILVQYINSKYIYDAVRHHLDTAIIHDTGYGKHLHLQCM